MDYQNTFRRIFLIKCLKKTTQLGSSSRSIKRIPPKINSKMPAMSLSENFVFLMDFMSISLNQNQTYENQWVFGTMN